MYTVICFYAKETKPIKLNIILNLTLWAIYDIAIHDLVSFTVDTVSAGAAVVSLFR
ncbi:MAG: YgjV family protein [Oscillospiraceae bacterium]|nr:YgjV family protein [Oscillospiraceae bacterium]